MTVVAGGPPRQPFPGGLWSAAGNAISPLARLWTDSAAGPSVFWTRRGNEILDHLQIRGVPADRSVTRLPWGVNAHHP